MEAGENVGRKDQGRDGEVGERSGGCVREEMEGGMESPGGEAGERSGGRIREEMEGGMERGEDAARAMREERMDKAEGGTEVLRMEVESRSRNEEFARVAVAVFMSRLDPTVEEIDDVKTAVSEAVTNAVIHGYQGREGIIYIQVAVRGREVSVEIRDEGVGIRDVQKAMEPMYTTDAVGERSGMGFSFMEAFMDEVQVESAPGQGTCVTMKKHIGR